MVDVSHTATDDTAHHLDLHGSNNTERQRHHLTLHVFHMRLDAESRPKSPSLSLLASWSSRGPSSRQFRYRTSLDSPQSVGRVAMEWFLHLPRSQGVPCVPDRHAWLTSAVAVDGWVADDKVACEMLAEWHATERHPLQSRVATCAPERQATLGLGAPGWVAVGNIQWAEDPQIVQFFVRHLFQSRVVPCISE
uniref:Uncharacterized protein n=1 Tax=Noctiluca scintillans TaxID=2966 RepID=A0A7S1FA74_NOCSC